MKLEHSRRNELQQSHIKQMSVVNLEWSSLPYLVKKWVGWLVDEWVDEVQALLS